MQSQLEIAFAIVRREHFARSGLDRLKHLEQVWRDWERHIGDLGLALVVLVPRRDQRLARCLSTGPDDAGVIFELD